MTFGTALFYIKIVLIHNSSKLRLNILPCFELILEYLVQVISIVAERFPRAWPQPPRRASSLAGSSAHAPAASLSVQKRSAIPAEVTSCAPINYRWQHRVQVGINLE